MFTPHAETSPQHGRHAPITETAYLDHLGSADDLVTTDDETKAGFAALALERNRQTAPLVEEARALQAAAQRAASPWDLPDMDRIRAGLLAAAGLSDKDVHRFGPEEKAEAVQNLIKNFLEPAGEKFVEELVFRFLLTRADGIELAMRNAGEALAQRKLSRAVIAALNVAGIRYRWRDRAASWIEMSADDSEIERTLQGLTWGVGSESRTLLYNLNVPIVGTTIDVCLFAGSPQPVVLSGYADARKFLALGELQGSIDPARADERWQTAGMALDQIYTAFEVSGHTPPTFFLGAGIEQGMASEIWGQLRAGRLANAANLNRHEQLYSLARWLCSL